ncbi:MAG: PorT family protein [Chitinophagales bacterium]|nr:PorT family protein [Chitinophagales bacterium]
MTKIKSLWFGLFLLSIGTTIYGQTNRFDVGVEGSPSLIFMGGNNYISSYQKPTIGFSSGLFFQFNFKKIISLRTNLSFERKGSIIYSQMIDVNGNPVGKVTTNINFDYLTFPLLVRATFGKKIHFFVNAGPYFGYLIKQTFVSKGDNIPNTTYDRTSDNKRFDIGISKGLGFSVPIKEKFEFSFEARNNLGLYNVSAVPIENNGTTKTNSTNFLFGFTYKFGQRASDTK